MATWYGVEVEVLVPLPHTVTLDPDWRNAVDHLTRWLERLEAKSLEMPFS